MWVQEIWRYPVKSMAGERLEAVSIQDSGIPGDRQVAVFDPKGRRPGRYLTARELPALLGFSASWRDGAVWVNGPELPLTRYDDRAVAEAVSEACGQRLLLRSSPAPILDDSPLHVVSLPTVRRLGAEMGMPVDLRRFRANLYLEGPDATAGEELAWVGSRVLVGDVELEAVKGCRRCALTTRDPDRPGAAWPALLRHLVEARGEVLGVYCSTVAAGQLRIGSAVRVGAPAGE